MKVRDVLRQLVEFDMDDEVEFVLTVKKGNTQAVINAPVEIMTVRPDEVVLEQVPDWQPNPGEESFGDIFQPL